MFKELITVILGFVLLLSSMIYLLNIFEEYKCNSTWKLSNFKTSYSFSTGCLIEVKPNEWIPSKNYREI